MKFKPKFMDPVVAQRKRHDAIEATFAAAKRENHCFVIIPNIALIDEDMPLIISLLHANPKITDINLTGNMLAESVRQLAEIKSLRVIDLSYNHCKIDDLNVLLACDHIQELVLQGVAFNPDDACKIANTTKQLNLDLSRGADLHFTNKDKQAIQQALERNRKQQAQSQGSLDFPLVKTQFKTDDSNGSRSDIFLSKISTID